MILKKIFGPLFSIIGKLGLFGVCAAFAITQLTEKDALLDKGKFLANLIWCVSGIIIALIFSKIGDKLTDSGYKKGGWLAFKRRAYGVLYVNILFYPLCIVGVLGLFSAVSLLLSLLFEFGAGFLLFAYIFYAVGFPCFLAALYLEKYVRRHCKSCGASLKGCGYEYAAQDVTRHYDPKNNKTTYTSKVRFEVDCEECGTENIWYATMKTDNEAIEKYIRHIVGRK